jgi:DNA-binding Lrp family transcriptional regulator
MTTAAPAAPSQVDIWCAQILEYLQTNARMGRKEMLRTLGIQENRIKGVLERLLAADQITRMGIGIYALPGATPPPPPPRRRPTTRHDVEAARVDFVVLKREVNAALTEALKLGKGAEVFKDPAAWMADEEPLDRLMGVMREMAAQLRRVRGVK